MLRQQCQLPRLNTHVIAVEGEFKGVLQVLDQLSETNHKAIPLRIEMDEFKIEEIGSNDTKRSWRLFFVF